MAEVVARRGGGDFGDRGITTVVIDRAAVDRFFQPGGDVYSWARNIAREVEVLAKASLVPGHGYRTGELQRSIGSSATPTAHSVISSVRATAKHALVYHNGSVPHEIHPNSYDFEGQLHFFWLKKGRWFKRYFPDNREGLQEYVRHPGFRGNPFLADAAEVILRQHQIY